MTKKSVFWQLAFMFYGVVLACVPAKADVINFEDLYPGYDTFDVLPADYAGLTWSDSAYFVTSQLVPGTGYEYGTVDQVSVATAFAQDLWFSSATPVNFLGAYIGAAWNSDEPVTVSGWRNGQLKYSSDIVTSYSGPFHFDFNFSNVDTIVFQLFDGTDADLGGGAGDHLVIDNINLTPYVPSGGGGSTGNDVPEPAPLMLLMLGGLAMSAFIVRRTKTGRQMS